MDRSCGFVLKSLYPFKKRLIVLDKHKGKISCTLFKAPYAPTISAGSYCFYRLRPSKGGYFLEDVDVCIVPSCSYRELIFLHTVLELCHYFIVEGGCFDGIFELLYFLFTYYATLDTDLQKKLFLWRVCVVLGVQPVEGRQEGVVLQRLSEESVDSLVQHSIDSVTEKALNSWLAKCIISHPQPNLFKATSFIMSSGDV